MYITPENKGKNMIDSVISEELRKRLGDHSQTADNEYLCKIHFDPAFRGFEGHFEGNPIVPGVCLIELARVHAEQVLNTALLVREISQCRFRSPILAGQSAECKMKIRKQDDPEIMIQAEIRADGNIACQVRMKAVTA